MIFTDQLQQPIALTHYPKRIISLVPSQTELIWDLGIREELVGITKFCIHPKQMHQSVTHVGGTKTLNIEKIKALKPDIIIGNKEENERSQILELQKQFPVWMSDIFTLEDSLNMIHDLGALLNKKAKSLEITHTIQQAFKSLPQLNKRTLYFIWNKPYMVAGCNTFIGDVLQRLGLINCIEEKDSRYPTLTIDEIKMLNPELILLSSEPFPFTQKHIEELQKHLPTTTICIVDGEAYSWYGSRLMQSIDEFKKLELFK